MNMKEVKMLYSKYKKTYSQYQTVKGTYDTKDKTIIVLLPENKAKIYEQKTGGRARYITLEFKDNNTGEIYSKLFNYFTSAKDFSSLKRRAKEFAKLNELTLLTEL